MAAYVIVTHPVKDFGALKKVTNTSSIGSFLYLSNDVVALFIFIFFTVINFFIVLKESFPEILIIAIADFPNGVESA